MHSKDHSFLTSRFADAGHALLAQEKRTRVCDDSKVQNGSVCVTWEMTFWNFLRLSAAVASPPLKLIAVLPLLFLTVPCCYTLSTSFLTSLLSPLLPSSFSSLSPLQLLQRSETGEKGCLATGCSWTNSMPPNELTVMCSNRRREQETGRSAW